MPGLLGRMQWIAVLSGGAICTLGAGAPTWAQDAASAAPVNRSEAVLSTGVGPSVSRANHVETFAALLREVGADDLAARKEAITGQKQPRVDWVTLNRASVGLSDEEWKVTYAILEEGSQRVADWGDEVQDALGWQEGRFEAERLRSDPAQRAAMSTQFDTLNAQGDSIVAATIAMLRERLREDAFDKLDAFVFQRESGKPVAAPGPIKKGPMETARVTPLSK